ncbi:lysine-sensitive aspartokinase 3, partial [Salmonella enterica]|nr:lysine-sensitive aspartokinase 3 [Salmonella enterica]
MLSESYENLYQLRQIDEVIVFPGFFGYTKTGEVCTFSRGGSDITGAILANGTRAALYENFTDVDAIYAANPNVVENPKRIKELTYREM